MTPHSVLPKALRRTGKRRLRLSIVGLGVRRTRHRLSPRHMRWVQRTVLAHIARLERQAKREHKAMAAR